MINTHSDHETLFWHITAPLCFQNIMAIKQKAHEYYPILNTQLSNNEVKHWSIVVNKSKLIDSAGLSWLLNQKAYAEKNHFNLKIAGLQTDQNATELAKVQGVFNLLV